MKVDAVTLDEIHRRENKKVAEWLLYYEERKAEHEKMCQDILLRMPGGPVLTASQDVSASDPTGRKIEQLSKLEETECWLKLVEEVERKLPWKMRIVLQLRREVKHRRGYSRGRPAWIPYVQHRYCREIARRENKDIEDVWVNSPDTFTAWWNRIVEYTAREAARCGLI